MKKLLALMLVLILAFSSCTVPQNAETPEENPPKESIALPEEESDEYAEKIARTRKKVYKILEENPDILAYVPNPSTNEAVPYAPIEGLPACVSEWFYDYFNYRVTLELPDSFKDCGYEDEISFLVAARRKKKDFAQSFEFAEIRITTFDLNADNNVWMLEVYLSCVPKKIDPETGELKGYGPETLRVFFSLYKVNGEWEIENDIIRGGEAFEYARDCINKTNGRFPEMDGYSEYKAYEAAIVEYNENFYDFRFIPNA